MSSNNTDNITATVSSPSTDRSTQATIRDSRQIRVRSSATVPRDIEDFSNIDITKLEDGSLLVYSTASEDWKATRKLSQQNLDGGNY